MLLLLLYFQWKKLLKIPIYISCTFRSKNCEIASIQNTNLPAYLETFLPTYLPTRYSSNWTSISENAIKMGEWYLHEFVDTPHFLGFWANQWRKGQGTSSQAQIRLHFFKNKQQSKHWMWWCASSCSQNRWFLFCFVWRSSNEKFLWRFGLVLIDTQVLDLCLFLGQLVIFCFSW